MDIFRFQNISFIYTLLFIPLAILIYLLAVNGRKKAWQKFGEESIVLRLAPYYSKYRRLLKLVLLLIGFFFLVIAILNPQYGMKKTDVTSRGSDIMFALDVSNSMRAEDLAPNRLENARNAIARLVDQLHGDRVGIVVFAGDAFVQLPITSDYSAVKLFLDMVDYSSVPVQGTAVGKAIDLAAESFGMESGKGRAIIVISDGENHEDDAIDAAQKAAQKGIQVYTIGMGSLKGTPIPVSDNSQSKEYKKDKNGNTVITQLNERLLKEVATAGKGVYVHATNSETGLNIIKRKIENLEKKEMATKMFADYESYFYYFIGAALLFFVADLFIAERRFRKKQYQQLS